MNDHKFAERLNTALDQEGFPPKNKGRIQLLAEMVGLTHRGASKWVNGESCPPAKKLPDLAKKLNVRTEWLKTGIEPMREDEDKESNVTSNHSTTIAVYDVEDILQNNKKLIRTVNCDLPVQGDGFAIILKTEAMSPRFPNGSVVIFDSGRDFKDGDFVLVKSSLYPVPIFRQLLVLGSSSYLNAHNPKFDRLTLSPTDKILGVMIQAILSFV